MAWYRAGDKPLTELMMTQFTDAYIFLFGPDELNAWGQVTTDGVVYQYMVWYINITP